MMRKDALDSVGLPLAVQVVGKRYKEELILRVLKELEEDREEEIETPLTF